MPKRGVEPFHGFSRRPAVLGDVRAGAVSRHADRRLSDARRELDNPPRIEARLAA